MAPTVDSPQQRIRLRSLESNNAAGRWRALELFAGIGGFAAAWPEVDVLAAIDIHRGAGKIYRQNYPHLYLIREIETLADDELMDFQANLWWLSPPCQPYSRRGLQRDFLDPRSAALMHLIHLLDRCRPEAIALENVAGFETSVSFQRLAAMLDKWNYRLAFRMICPTELGWPNRRPRFYLLASRNQPQPWRPLPQYALRLADFVDRQFDNDDALRISDEIAERYRDALSVVDLRQSKAITACFTSSYGKTVVRSGSYLRVAGGLRLFSPREMASLLGFSPSYRLDDERLTQTPSMRVSQRRALWKLLGNSLSIPVVRYVLSHLDGFPLCHPTIRPCDLH